MTQSLKAPLRRRDEIELTLNCGTSGRNALSDIDISDSEKISGQQRWTLVEQNDPAASPGKQTQEEACFEKHVGSCLPARSPRRRRDCVVWRHQNENDVYCTADLLKLFNKRLPPGCEIAQDL